MYNTVKAIGLAMLALPMVTGCVDRDKRHDKREDFPFNFPDDNLPAQPPEKEQPAVPDMIPRNNATFEEHEFIIVNRHDCLHDAQLFLPRDIGQARNGMLDYCDRFMVPGQTRLVATSKNGESAYYVCNYSKWPVGCSRREFAQAEDRWIDKACGPLGSGWAHMHKWLKRYGRAHVGNNEVCPGGSKMVTVMFKGLFGTSTKDDADWCGEYEEGKPKPNVKGGDERWTLDDGDSRKNTGSSGMAKGDPKEQNEAQGNSRDKQESAEGEERKDGGQPGDGVEGKASAATISASVGGNATPTRPNRVFGAMETILGTHKAETASSSSHTVTATRALEDTKPLETDKPVHFTAWTTSLRSIQRSR